MDKQHILVVEDHKPLLAGIQDILETEGYAVSTAVNGAEALQAMEQARPDLIVADIMMPVMDGYALYKTVRNRSEWTAIPIIFLTSKAEEEDLLQGKKLGVNGYITKPFDPNKLLEMIETLLKGVPQRHEM